MEETKTSLPAAKPVTIKHIADELGIHKSSVSLALSGKGRISAEMRQRILARADELGYEPDPLAQRLANRSSDKTVCLCSAVLDLGRGTEKIVGIQTALTAAGWDVPIYTAAQPKGGSDDSQSKLFRQMRRQRPRAILCATHLLSDAAFREIELYRQEGGIVVSYDVPVPLDCDQVIYDREDNAYQGAHYLLERGHRSLGIGMSRLSGSPSAPANLPQNLRLKGFRRAMAEFNLPMQSDWLFENTSFERGGAEMARHFLELKSRPTGLCIVNDYVALAFMVEVMRAGVRVPEDLSIIGHDNQPIAAYCPVPLTSVSQPAEEIVSTVVTLVLERLNGSTAPPHTVVIPSRIVERRSVAPPPGR